MSDWMGISAGALVRKAPDGAVVDEDWAPADEDGLARLVARLGPDVTASVEMMSGAAWVRDRLRAGGWRVRVANARKAKAVASLAAKTDRLDARVLAELARRDLVLEVWVPCFGDRELKERLGGACTWCGCGRRRSTAPTACSPSSVSGWPSVGSVGPMPASCSSAVASRRCGGAR
jgi:hypothetical protein